MDPELARRLWACVEPIHGICYFAPAAVAALKTSGTRGFWMGYTAARIAPLGPVGPAVAEAAFANFAPSLVRRALPDAWSFTTPERVLAAQLEGIDAALGELVDVRAAEIAEAATLARGAAEVAAADTLGRPLGAAHGALPWPEPPHLQLWRAATILREHRGDGHVAALLVAGLDGPGAHHLRVAEQAADAEGRRVGAEQLRSVRGYDEAAWEAGRQRLVDRGLLASDGSLTAAGRQVRTEVEARTDAAAAAPADHLGVGRVERLEALTAPLRETILDSGWFPFPNPIGFPRA
ncbi:hypothetical protein FTX61_06000 [Nitriliruptoraceae bacterium ZYF776]|nr:hypothetical protein [Profundirhabdus halotolerans]